MPDAEHKVLRDLVRAREPAKKDQLRAPPSAALAFPRRARLGLEGRQPSLDEHPDHLRLRRLAQPFCEVLFS